MEVRGLKEKITSGALISPLPPVLRALFCAGHDAPLRQGVWRAAIQDDPAAAAVVMEAARVRTPASAPCDLEDAFALLGLDGVKAVLLRHACLHLFPTNGAKRLDRRSFWRHALRCARWCEEVARLSGRCNPGDAYAAGLLHDIGKIALDLAAPEGYSRVIEAVGAHGLTALDAETRELGADHAQAGKWLIEWWGMPAAFAEAAWLHHHHPASLAPLPAAAPLIHIVAIADWLAHLGDAARIGDAAPPDTIETRRDALGIRAQDFAGLIARNPGPEESLADDDAGAAAPQLATPGAPSESALRQRLRRYQSLHAMHQRLQTAVDGMAALRILCESIRDAFGITAGLCYTGRSDGGIQGVRWRDTVSEIQPFEINDAPLAPEVESPHAQRLRALIEQLAPDPGVLNQTLLRHGLVAVPIAAGGHAYGQIIFDAADCHRPPGGEDFADLMAFAAAVGAALARAETIQRSEAFNDALAAALWKQELAQKKAAHGERLAGIAYVAGRAAHEINNPLAAISGRAQLLMNRSVAPEDHAAIETIIQQSQRISKILQDLLQFAKPGAPQFQPTAIVPLLRKAVADRQERLTAQGIRVVEDFAQAIPPVRADRAQLEQAFAKLVQNAVEAMAGNGGILTLRVKAVHDQKAVVIQIADTGRGIAPEALDQVFEPFFTTHTGNENSGLGLAVCHGIIEQHRGSITLHSREGEGATCTVTLPAAVEGDYAAIAAAQAAADQPPQDTAPPRPASTAADAPPARRPLALIADAGEELREVLAATLATQGFDVITAADGLETLAAALSKDVDLAIVDLTLDAADGSPAYQFLRVRNPRMPIILLAPADMDDTSTVGFEYGVNGCLQKPFDIAALLGIIRKISAARSVA